MENNNGERTIAPKAERKFKRLQAGFELAEELELRRQRKANGNGNGKKPAVSLSPAPKPEPEKAVLEPALVESQRRRQKEQWQQIRSELRLPVALRAVSTFKRDREKFMPQTPEANQARQEAYREIGRNAILAKKKELQGRFLQRIVKRAGELVGRK